MLSTNEVAQQLGIEPDTVRQQIRNGRLHARRFGTMWVVTPEEVERYRRTSLRPQPEKVA